MREEWNKGKEEAVVLPILTLVILHCPVCLCSFAVEALAHHDILGPRLSRAAQPILTMDTRALGASNWRALSSPHA